MNLTDKQPAELDFHRMIGEVKSFLDKCDSRYLDSDDRERIMNELRTIKDKQFNLQMKRFTQYLNDRGKVEGLSEDEGNIQKEMTGLTMRISRFRND
jgi:hypothetical protein